MSTFQVGDVLIYEVSNRRLVGKLLEFNPATLQGMIEILEDNGWCEVGHHGSDTFDSRWRLYKGGLKSDEYKKMGIEGMTFNQRKLKWKL